MFERNQTLALCILIIKLDYQFKPVLVQSRCPVWVAFRDGIRPQLDHRVRYDLVRAVVKQDTVMLYMLGQAIIPLTLIISITYQECSDLYICRDERRQNRTSFPKMKTSNTKRSIFATHFGDFGHSNFYLELKLRNL